MDKPQDIVERLRDLDISSFQASGLLDEAADYIERLRSERPAMDGWLDEKKELQEAIHELQEDLMKATGGTMPSKRNAMQAIGWREAIEAAAKVAENGCLVPPDGGSPTEDERFMCEIIATAIRALPCPPGAPSGKDELREALEVTRMQLSVRMAGKIALSDAKWFSIVDEALGAP